MTPARLLAALPSAAQALAAAACLDPAAAFLAAHDGLTAEQARSRARNVRRSLGSSWPDRVPLCGLEDLDFAGIFTADPLDALLAAEAVQAALDAPGSEQRLAAAALRDIDTRQLADRDHITMRRVQQLRAQVLTLCEAGQLALFQEGEV